LNHIEKNSVANDGKKAEDGCGNQSGARQYVGKLPAGAFLNDIGQVDDKKEWV